MSFDWCDVMFGLMFFEVKDERCFGCFIGKRCVSSHQKDCSRFLMTRLFSFPFDFFSEEILSKALHECVCASQCQQERERERKEMALPFKLVSAQGVWFLGSLGAVVGGALHFVSLPLSLVLVRLFPAHAMHIMWTVRMLYLQTYASIAISYAATLVACVGGWWEQAKKSPSKWVCFVLFLFLSDSMHYIAYCAIFVTAVNELYWTSRLCFLLSTQSPSVFSMFFVAQFTSHLLCMLC